MNKPQFTRLSVWLSYWLLCATQAQAMSPLPPLEPDYNNAALVAQWIDDDPELPQALTSTSPEDFTASDYGCHTYIYRTAAHTYNLFFTTKKPVLETQIEYQQKTRDVKKTRLVDKTRQVKKTRQVQKTRQVSKVRTVTKTREVWKTTQVANVIYPVYKTRQILKTRTVYAPWWWWSFGMGWHSWEEPYWVTETYTTFELKWEDQRYRAVETYKEQEPYTATENYTVTEPYSVTETYSDIEAYTDQETYTETVEVKKVVSKDCRQQLTVISLMDDINTDKAYRFVLDNNVGLVVKVSAVQAKQTQGPLAYRILELTAIDALSSTLINSILPIVSNVEYKQRESYWLRLNSIHIKKLVPHIPVLSLSQGLNSLKLAWNNTKYTDNYGVEVAYNGNNWQTLATVKSDQYVFPYNSQWHLDKTQFRINACRDNGNTCSRSNSQALSTAVTKPIASDKHLIAMANTPIEINLAESNNNKFMHTSLPKYGQAILAADGMLTYTPTAGYAGVDELSYKISNKNYTEIHSNSAKITISVIAFTGAAEADRINGNTQATEAIKSIISISKPKDWVEIEAIEKQAAILATKAFKEANQALATAKQKAQAGLTTAAIDAAKADTINGNTQATNAIANALDTATTLAETDTKKTQAITGAQNALIGANQALATAKQQAITALTTADSNATKADTINGDTQAANAIANALDTAATITEIASKTTEAITGAQNALIQANQALAAAKQKAQAGLTTADSNAAKADTINGNTQATNAIENALDTATTLAQIATQKTQAITGAQNALIGANQALATAKQQAITALTTADSDAAKADTIKGDTQAVDAVANSINTATTIAEIASKTTEASAEAKQALAKAVKLKIKPQLTITIDSPASLTTLGATPVTVSGKVAGGIIALTVNGAPVTPDDGRFTADVSLREGHNSIVARAVDGQNNVSTASISVSLDMTPPTITVESPTSGKTLYSDKVTVTGLINDIVRGTIEQHQANVIANGIAGTVSNRSYSVKDIPLQLGENKISLTASDQVGNSAQKTITIHYKQPLGKKLQLLSGQDQSAQIGAVIDQPLAVKVVDDADAPVADQAVVFRVIQGSGALAPNTEQQGRAVAITTNADGEAQTNFRLGQRVGTANHKVRATITGYAGEITFNASGLAKIGNKISINSGNNQRGVAGQPLPAPFVVAITDAGANVVSGSRVKFQVTEGSGRFYDSKNDYQTGEFIAKTDSDGRVSVQFILGQLQGLDAQRVTATLIDSPQGKTLSAGFTASAFIPADPGKTSLSGVVLNNQDQPLQGVTLRIEGTTRQAVSNDQGRFTITEVPVGPVHLIADGSTALASGEYPSLGYQLVTIAGVDNPMATPIYMVKLDIQGAEYAGKKDISLTLEKFPGFQLDIAKGSVTFPDGAKEGFISVTSVNASAVPMAPPNGMQPQFIVTIQPAGTLFDPPARLSLPNVDGHAPGAQVEMYSFDHDLEEFVAIGLGTVAEDGSVVATNAGVGVIKAGWHCGSQPADSGCVSGKGCPFCQTSATNDCNNNDCVDDPAKAEAPLPQQIEGNCQTATCGGSVAADGDISPEDEVCKTCQNGELQNKPDSVEPLPSDRCQICQNGQLKSKLELNDVPEPAKGAELEFDVTKATKSAGSLIKKINTGLSKLGIAAEVSNVTIGAAGKFKHCCVPETGEIQQNQTQEASAQVGLTIEADEVKMPGVSYGFENKRIESEIATIKFTAFVGVLVSADANIAISTGLRTEGCGGDTCNFGTATLGISPTLNPKADFKACVEILDNEQCLRAGIEAPISTSLSASFDYNKSACNQGVSGSGTIGAIKATGSIFAELGIFKYHYPFEEIELYKGAKF